MSDSKRIKEIEQKIKALMKELSGLQEENGFISGSSIKTLEQRYYEEIIKHSSGMHYIHDTKNVLQYISPNCKQFFGYNQKEMKMNWRKLVSDNPVNTKGIELTDRAIKKGRKQQPYILELVKKDGTRFWAEAEESPMKDRNGKVIGIIGVLKDITTQKEYQDKLQENERMLRLIHSSVNDIIWKLDDKMNFSYVSPSVEQVLGYKVEEVTGTSVTKYLSRESLKKFKEGIESRIKKGEDYNDNGNSQRIYTMMGAGGREVEVEVSSSIIRDERGRIIGFSGITRDISERIRARRKIEESEYKFRELFEKMQSGVAIYEVAGNGKKFILNDINDAGLDIVRMEKKAMQGKELREILPEMDGYGLPEVFERVWKTGVSEKMPIKVYQDSRIIQWLENIVYKIPKGQIINIFQDTSKEHKILNELKESRLRYKQLVDNISGLICEIDREGNFVFVNDQYQAVLGYDPAELIGRNAGELIHPEDHKRSVPRLKELIETKENSVDTWRFRNSEGEYLSFECHATVYEDLEKNLRIVVVSYDVTEKIKNESRFTIERQRLQRAEKVAEFGHWEFDLNTGKGEASGNACAIYGITENTFEIEEIQKIPLKEYRTALDRALTNLIRKGMPYNVIFRIRRPSDGVLRDIHSIAHFSRENNRVFGVIHDITDTLQRERALQESEKRFRRVIEENPLPMVLTDKNQDIISFNKKFTDFYGYTTDDIKTAEQWWTTVYPDEEYREKVRMMWDPAAESAMESKGEIDKQTRYITCKDGEVKTVEFRFVSLGDINVISMVDLTELKNFEKELIENKNKITSQYEELAALNEELQSNLEESSRINRKLEKAKQGLSDSQQRATRLLDQTRKRNTEISMLLAGAREVLESDDFESTARKLYRYIQKITRSHDGFISMRNQESGNQEVILLFQHNRFRKVSHQFTVPTGRIFATADKQTDAVIYNEVKDQHFMSGLPDSHPKIQRAIFVPLILENSLKGTFCLANKKGEYTREEKKIVSAFGELAAIALLNSFNLEELRNQKEKAEESDRLKSAFLSNMSHEIRTPMNSIVGFSEFLSRDRISDEKRKKFSRLIAGSSEQLMSLINDIIDISKIESNQLKIEKSWFHLKEELEDIYAHYREALSLSEKHLKMVMKADFETLPSYLHTDKVRFRQIMDNLIMNAIKFTREGEITLEAEMVTLKDEDHIRITVSDTGIGIPESKHHTIFERFVQAHDESVSKGTGLGLSIIRGLVKLLDGSLGFRSREGEGSSFYFSLPSRGEESYESDKPVYSQDQSIPDFSAKTIYIADDDPASIILLQEILADTGIRIQEFNNGEAVLNAVEEEIPDLILIDVNMPVLDGISAVRKLREKHSDIPVIAQTAYAMVEERNRCMEAGCDDYITKPISHELLLATLADYLSDS